MVKTIGVIFTTLLLTSCISYHHEGTDAYSQSISMQRGITTSEWVYDHLGHPLSSYSTENGSEILQYQFDEQEETSVHLFLVLNFHNREHGLSNLFIEIRDGIVRDYWQD